MTKEIEPVWGYLKIFRKSIYFQQVIDEGYVAKLGGLIIEGSLNDSDDEFIEGISEFLVNNTMLQPRTIQPFINSNSVEEIRNACNMFVAEDIEPVEFCY